MVDQIGGLSDAIHYAVAAAGVEDSWVVTQIPEPQKLAESISELLNQTPGTPPLIQSPAHDMVTATVRKLTDELATLRSFNDPRNVYARIPFSLEIQ